MNVCFCWKVYLDVDFFFTDWLETLVWSSVCNTILFGATCNVFFLNATYVVKKMKLLSLFAFCIFFLCFLKLRFINALSLNQQYFDYLNKEKLDVSSG